MVKPTALLALGPCLVSAAVHQVQVGKTGLVFSPNELKAAPGDAVNFHFFPGNHSVAESTFQAPCVPSGSDAIWSGFINPTSGVDSKMFSITIKNNDPLWLYCAQISHCQIGMSMVINPPTGETIQEYATAAKKSTTKVPSKVSGGVIVANSNAAPGGSSGASSAAQSASSKASSVASSAVSKASSIASSASSKASSAISKATSKAVSVASSAKKAATSEYGSVTSKYGSVTSEAAKSTSKASSSNAAAATHVPAALVAGAGLLALL